MGLPDLYPAQVGSPYTTLAAPYTTGGATMSVVDATKLPDAPNIVCLAGSVSGEFRYAGKDGNILQGVAALPGTPAATWAIGTYAFRGVAAYDTNALQTRAVAVQNQVDFLAQLNSPIIGIEWDTASTSPTLTRIDAAGTPLEGLDSTFFDKHGIFGTRWRCTRNRATGAIEFGTNPRGDGLDLSGALADVLVRKQAFYAKHEFDDGTDLARYWVSPRPAKGFSLHPYFYMRGGGVPAPYMFSGAYESYGLIYNGEFRLGSASGKIPITGGVAYPDLPNSGRFHINDAELYASRISPGNAGCESFWGYCADQLLMYIEYGTFDIQTALGKGIVDLSSGQGFAGKLTGADNIDSRLAENGTGTGDGVNGQTPVCWRGIENPYGNTWKFIIGANVNLDGSFRLIRRDGLGILAGTLAEGSYEAGTGMATTTGYISGLLHDDLAGLAFIPSATSGSSDTYLTDQLYAVTANGNILLAGGAWIHALDAGPGYRFAANGPTTSYRRSCARVELRQLEEGLPHVS